jgi:hypothetical protein
MRFLILVSVLLGTTAAQAESPFWSHWSDGKAELNGYDLVQPRYGELRTGKAVLVFVTEPFSRAKGVKVDAFNQKNPDHFTALKLNHVRDFPTGIYDYNLMTSVFVDPAQGFAPVKVSFTGQEWCGHVFEEARFDAQKASVAINSYFEGESTQATLPAVGSEDALFIQVRQLAAQTLSTDAHTLTVLPSAIMRRLRHRPAVPGRIEVKWSDERTVTVPAGSFTVQGATWARPTGGTCTIDVETTYPHRITGWQCSDGEKAALRGTTRLPYWQLHGNADEKYLKQLGF